MKRVFLRAGIAIAIVIAIFILLIIGIVIIVHDENERGEYAYQVGYYFGMFLVVFIPAIILYVTYQLTIARYRKSRDDNSINDSDGPIDRYLK